MKKMTVDQMRERITTVYGGPRWRLRVQEMDDRQVIAIYKDMERHGRFDRKPKKLKSKTDALCEEVQLTIFDLLKEQEGEKNGGFNL